MSFLSANEVAVNDPILVYGPPCVPETYTLYDVAPVDEVQLSVTTWPTTTVYTLDDLSCALAPTAEAADARARTIVRNHFTNDYLSRREKQLQFVT